MFKSLVSLTIFALVCSSYATAQTPTEVSSADVNIVSIKAEATADRFVCTAEINNQNSDDAYNTQVVVLLPLEVKITNMAVLQGSGNCKRSEALGEYHGYATCNLGQLPQGPDVRRTVKITTTKSAVASFYPQTCAAFIYSRTGDINKDNNYKPATAP